ncbi:MAG: dTMP kinase [Actinomycetia bacterium]|nr:dTMP kinase [Actinomycetes bacterium]
MTGYFIAFEGGEGVGKSTQEALLAEYLTEIGKTVIRTREPGGTPAAEQIRNTVLSLEHEGMNPQSEALLFAAARGDHVARVIRPAIARGDVIICDRYIDSSVAYQGYARALGADRIRDLSMWATGGLLPNLTIVLTLDPEVSMKRVVNPDRMEAEPMQYHRDVAEAFLEIAGLDPDRYLVVDATGTQEEIGQVIRQRVMQELN